MSAYLASDRPTARRTLAGTPDRYSSACYIRSMITHVRDIPALVLLGNSSYLAGLGNPLDVLRSVHQQTDLNCRPPASRNTLAAGAHRYPQPASPDLLSAVQYCDLARAPWPVIWQGQASIRPVLLPLSLACSASQRALRCMCCLPVVLMSFFRRPSITNRTHFGRARCSSPPLCSAF